MLDKLGGRKVVLTLIFLAAGVALELTVGLSSNMLALLLGLPSAFIIGNGVEHATGGQKKFSTLLDEQKRMLDFLNKYRQGLAEGLRNMAVSFNSLTEEFQKLRVKMEGEDERKHKTKPNSKRRAKA